MGDAAGALDEAIDALFDEGPLCHADAESMEGLHRAMARLEAFVTEAAAAFDASGAWAPDGARDAAAWLAVRCRLPRATARRRVRLGRRLRELPACARAWERGEIHEDHVRAIASAGTPSAQAALQRDEAMLVDHAQRLRFEGFRRALSYWEQLADPDGTDQADAERAGDRSLYLSESFAGMWLGRITLDPVSGTIVGDELERLEGELFESDWAAARLRLGRDPKAEELDRTSVQRRADALVEMATRSKAMPQDARRPIPLFSVFVGYETLCGRILELANGSVVAPGSLVPWLDKAAIERAVFAPPRRVEISATTRLFTGATRRAIELRVRECTHPYCDRPVAECEVDHIVPYSEGGPTTQENGRLLCSFHNRLRNQRPPPAA